MVKRTRHAPLPREQRACAASVGRGWGWGPSFVFAGTTITIPGFLVIAAVLYALMAAEEEAGVRAALVKPTAPVGLPYAGRISDNCSMTIIVASSSKEIMANPARLIEAMRSGSIIRIPDLDYTIAPTTAIAALADERAEEELLEEMFSYRKDVTGVENTVFISPKGNTRHAPRIKVAIDPPQSVDPRTETASVAIADGTVVAGEVPSWLLDQARRFIDANRDVLLDYWEYRIDTDELRRRLNPV
jgi:hypothetical protein